MSFYLIKTEWTTLFTFQQSHFIKKISFQVHKTKLNVEEVQIQCNLIKLMYCWHRVSSLMTAFSHIRKWFCASFLCASLVHFSINLCQKSLSLCLVNILPKCLNLQEIWLCRSVSGLTDNDWRWGGVCHTYILQYYTQQYYTEYQSCDQRVSMHSMIQRRKRELWEAIYVKI